MHLTPLSDVEYTEFVEQQVADRALQLVRAGETDEAHSKQSAQALLAALLADQLRPAGHSFFVGRSAIVKQRVGWVWLSPGPASLGAQRSQCRWLSQLTVDRRQGRGWDRALLRATERHLVSIGVNQLWLRVFDWNLAARALYDAQGFELVERFESDSHLRKFLF